MHIAQRSAFAVGLALVVFVAGTAPAEFDDSPPGFWQVDETEPPSSAEDVATPEPDRHINGENETSDADAEPHPDDELTDEPWSDEDWDEEEFEGEEWDESDWGDDSDDGCHGVLSCSFSLVGQAVALPFRILGGVFRFAF